MSCDRNKKHDLYDWLFLLWFAVIAVSFASLACSFWHPQSRHDTYTATHEYHYTGLEDTPSEPCEACKCKAGEDCCKCKEPCPPDCDCNGSCVCGCQKGGECGCPRAKDLKEPQKEPHVTEIIIDLSKPLKEVPPDLCPPEEPAPELPKKPTPKVTPKKPVPKLPDCPSP